VAGTAAVPITVASLIGSQFEVVDEDPDDGVLSHPGTTKMEITGTIKDSSFERLLVFIT
jgi:hypothetical protein